jgi:hypothetical protein
MKSNVSKQNKATPSTELYILFWEGKYSSVECISCDLVSISAECPITFMHHIFMLLL